MEEDGAVAETVVSSPYKSLPPSQTKSGSPQSLPPAQTKSGSPQSVSGRSPRFAESSAPPASPKPAKLPKELIAASKRKKKQSPKDRGWVAPIQITSTRPY